MTAGGLAVTVHGRASLLACLRQASPVSHLVPNLHTRLRMRCSPKGGNPVSAPPPPSVPRPVRVRISAPASVTGSGCTRKSIRICRPLRSVPGSGDSLECRPSRPTPKPGDTLGNSGQLDAVSCPSLAQRAARWGSISRTSHGQTIKRPDSRFRRSSPDLHLLGRAGSVQPQDIEDRVSEREDLVEPLMESNHRPSPYHGVAGSVGRQQILLNSSAKNRSG